MSAAPLGGLRIAVFVTPAAGDVTRALTARGASVERVVTSTGALDALLHGRRQVLVTDRIVPGVLLVMQPRHLLAGPSPASAFGDQFVECMETPVDPAALAAAVARAARRLIAIQPASGNGTEAA